MITTLAKIEGAGFTLSLSDAGQLSISGKGLKLTEAQRIWITANRSTLIEALAARASDLADQIEERAAIMEYDAGMTREAAEAAALGEVRDHPLLEATLATFSGARMIGSQAPREISLPWRSSKPSEAGRERRA